MQQRVQSTAIPTSPEAEPPSIEPDRWEDFEGFRETFLTHLTDPGHNAACRAFGELLYNLILEAPAVTQMPPERFVPLRVRGALGDLRFLEGFLAALGREPRDVEMTPENTALCRKMARTARALGKVAAGVEEALAAAEV